MKATEISNILTSTSNEDWIVSEEKGSYTYSQDVLLRIQKRPIDFSDEFVGENWAVDHPDTKAYRVIYDVYYGDSLIDTKTLVAVDGLRATLPMPKHGTTEIPFKEYRFARIVAPDSLDEYIERSGLMVVPAN